MLCSSTENKGDSLRKYSVATHFTKPVHSKVDMPKAKLQVTSTITLSELGGNDPLQDLAEIPDMNVFMWICRLVYQQESMCKI